MGEEEKNSSPNIEAIEAAAEDRPEEQHTAAETSPEDEPVLAQASLNHKRGRMIAGGLVTAVVVTLVVVLVAGIFQLSSKWLRPCPAELPVNDPSPKLWQEMVSQKVTIQGLGVPEKVRAETQLKKVAPVPNDAGNDTKAKEGK